MRPPYTTSNATGSGRPFYGDESAGATGLVAAGFTPGFESIIMPLRHTEAYPVREPAVQVFMYAELRGDLDC